VALGYKQWLQVEAAVSDTEAIVGTAAGLPPKRRTDSCTYPALLAGLDTHPECGKQNRPSVARNSFAPANVAPARVRQLLGK